MSCEVRPPCEGKATLHIVIYEPNSFVGESILSMESLPCNNYSNMDFPREWRVRWLPVGGSNENELHTLRTELSALKDRVSQLESRNCAEKSHYSSMDTLYSAIMEKPVRYVSTLIIDIESNLGTSSQMDSFNLSSEKSDCESESDSNGNRNVCDGQVVHPNHVENSSVNESVELCPVYGTDTMESSEGNESVKPSVIDINKWETEYHESVEPSPDYGTDTTGSSEGNESVELSVGQPANMPGLQSNNETSASDALSIDLSHLFEDTHSQMDGERVSSVNSESQDRLLNDSSQTTELGHVLKCPMCPGQDTHSIWKCGTFKCLNLDGRWKKAKELGLCYRCLGKRHKASTCKRTKICGINKCRLNHATLLHDENRRRMLREMKSKPVNEDPHPPADTGVGGGLYESARNGEDESPDHLEHSGGENGKFMDSETPVHSDAYSHDVIETKSDVDLMLWLMPIPVPAVDPGGS